MGLGILCNRTRQSFYQQLNNSGSSKQEGSKVSRNQLVDFRGRPTLTNWQSAVLAYASNKCGSVLIGISETDEWLRQNPQSPGHLAVRALRALMVCDPPMPLTPREKRFLKDWLEKRTAPV